MKLKLITLTALLSLSSLACANQWYFNKLDVDQNGTIDVEEFKQNTKGWMDKKDIQDQAQRTKLNQNGFNKIDTNKDSKISFEEYEANKKKKNKNKKNKKKS